VTPDSGKVYVRGLDADAYTLTETEAPAGYNLLSAPVNVVVHRATENVIDGNYYLSDDDNQNVNEIGVINKTGSLLPSTGGMGTTLFYIIGGVLIIAGVAYFMVRRKADAE
jgi:LPXTG-motif cell wall-anchored protein